MPRKYKTEVTTKIFEGRPLQVICDAADYIRDLRYLIKSGDIYVTNVDAKNIRIRFDIVFE